MLEALKVPGQKAEPGIDVGACDGATRDQPQALTPFRFDTGLIKFSRTATNLVVAAAFSIKLFQQGRDEADTGAGYPGAVVKSEIETNSFKSGAMVQSKQKFRAVGMAVHIGKPFTLGAGNERQYDAWLEAYAEAMQRAMIENMGAIVTHEGSKCEYHLGVLADWPADGGANGGTLPSNGMPLPATGGNFAAFRALEISGARDEADKLILTLKNGAQGVIVANNAAVPTVADAYLPVRVKLLGEPARCQ